MIHNTPGSRICARSQIKTSFRRIVVSVTAISFVIASSYYQMRHQPNEIEFAPRPTIGVLVSGFAYRFS